MAGLHVPLLTLRDQPRGWPRIARGRCGSLVLHRTTLAFATPRRLTRRNLLPAPTPRLRTRVPRDAANLRQGRTWLAITQWSHVIWNARLTHGAERQVVRQPVTHARSASSCG